MKKYKWLNGLSIILALFFLFGILIIVMFLQDENADEYNFDSDNEKSNVDMTLEESIYTTSLKKERINAMYSCYFGGESEIVYENLEETISNIKSQGDYNSITIPIAWSIVEKNEGEFDFSLYKPVFDKLIDNGYKLIIIIDAGGRAILKNGEVIDWSIPDWVWEKYPNCMAKDFDGEKLGTFDYFSMEAVGQVGIFYNEVINWLNLNYKSNIEALSPGIMGEGEIKYSQNGFKWQSYTDSAKEEFQGYLEKKYRNVDNMNTILQSQYKSFSEIEIPKINYNNTVASPNVGESGLYTELMECRENQIVKYVKCFTDIIKKNNYETVGYFGQFMFPLDAIYATGVITKCQDLFDIVVIDYNFYDGYKECYNTDIPAYLTNLVSNLGYKKVYTGMYFERVSLNDKEQFVKELCDNIVKDGHSNGFEIGSLTRNTTGTINFVLPETKNIEKSKIAIYTSEWNYYKTHGEMEEYQDYLSDSVTMLYHILQFELNIPVEVITDYNIKNKEFNNYDIIFLPCQIFVPADSKQALIEYAKQGGKLIQDFRFGEYDNYGRLTNDWANDIFKIDTICSYSKGGNLLYFEKNMKIPIKNIYTDIPTYYGFVAESDSEYLCSLKKNYIGIKTPNTIIWGFQPQLQYKQDTDSRWLHVINNSIISLQK